MRRTYTIEAGEHYSSGLHLSLFFWRTFLRFRATFSANCIYVPQQNPGQINKLFGMSFGKHHVSSARIGWRSDGARIELLSYVYVRKNERMWRSLGFADPEVPLTFSIRRNRTDVETAWDGHQSHHNAIMDPKSWGYYLYPYFGGEQAAPHKMTIEVEILEKNGLGF